MNVIFKLIGPYENSSYSLTNDEIKKLNYNNAVECIGFKEDITNDIKECVFLFYHHIMKVCQDFFRGFIYRSSHHYH